MKDYMEGRRLLKNEIPPQFLSKLKSSGIDQVRSMKRLSHERLQCGRCGRRFERIKGFMTGYAGINYYCPFCLTLGRVDEQNCLYGRSQRRREVKFDYLWKGQLTCAQEKVSFQLINYAEKKQDVLVHAVTGAGKTEMIFGVIADSLKKGKRVAVTSPRVDVCLELYPRLKEAFSLEIALLYGKQEEPYFYSSLVLCTTHQLLRFYHAFDLVILDEVDAFPFRDNLMLENGVKRACQPEGSFIYLTATPTKQFKEKIRKKALAIEYVPIRYHGHPLPVPQAIWCWRCFDMLRYRRRLPNLLKKLLKQQYQQKRVTLIFCPVISVLPVMEGLIKELLPNARVTSASTKDSERYEKIEGMRQQLFDFLVTTTILERGVTFSNIDVIVFASNHQVFSESSLIQISGRVGRKAEYPNGEVYFLHDGWSREMKQALKAIKQMNREGRNYHEM